MTAGEIIFWGSLALVFYAYAGYPIVLGLIGAIARLFRKSNTAGEAPDNSQIQYSVAVIIAAYNEEKHIRQRLENLLNQSFPQARLHIYVGTDGCADRTADIVREFTSPCITLREFTKNRGKMSVLNDLVAATRQDILVFTDANTEFDEHAISRLVANFADPQVGVVCGELQMYPHGAKRNEDHTYWRYEQWLKEQEGRLGGLLGANGGIYAIRREVYTPQPANMIVDDFVISMSVYFKKYRLVYDKTAKAYEETAPDLAGEWRRRVRIGIGNYQALWRLKSLLLPTYGMVAFTFLSHKVLRWLVPHFLLIALITSGLMWSQPCYRYLFIVQVIGYLLVWIMYKLAMKTRLPRIIQLPTFLVALNVAMFVGFLKAVFGKQTGTWKRTER